MRNFVPLLIFLSACTLGPRNFESRHSTDLGLREIKRIAVLPSSPMPGGQKAQASYLGGSVNGKGSETNAGMVLANLLYTTLTSMPNWQIVSDLEVKDVGPSVPEGSTAARARKLGELVYADAVMTSRVLRYRERIGEEWGAKSPASVAFVLELWDVKRGDLIWSARFDETQKPLSENLFALGELTQRGVKWLKAEELALQGVKKAVGQLHQALYRGAT
jgi:hypothetical protein